MLGGPRPAARDDAVQSVAVQRHGLLEPRQPTPDRWRPRRDSESDHSGSVLCPLGRGPLLVYWNRPGFAVAPPRLKGPQRGEDARRILGVDEDLPTTPPPPTRMQYEHTSF